MRAFLSCLCLLLCLAGCNTVTPRPARLPNQISFDTGEQNGGILLLTKSGAQVTPRALERYQALIEIYGTRFTPSLRPGHEVLIDSGSIFLGPDALEKFIVMNQWRRMGR